MFLYILLVLFHIFVCVALVFFVLIQSNKGMGLSSAFGAMGGADSLFSASGGMNVLIKITIGLCIVFTVSTIVLTIVRPPTYQGVIASEASQHPQSTTDLIQQSQVTDQQTQEASQASAGGTNPSGGQPAPDSQQ